MAGALSRDTSRGQVVALAFGQTDLAVSQTDVQLVTAIGETGQANDGYTMPWAWEVIGFGWQLTAASTAGTLSIGVTAGGTENAATTIAVPIDSTTVSGYKRVQRGKMAGAAGAVIGVEITTNGSYAPITADLGVVVYVLLNLDGV